MAIDKKPQIKHKPEPEAITINDQLIDMMNTFTLVFTKWTALSERIRIIRNAKKLGRTLAQEDRATYSCAKFMEYPLCLMPLKYAFTYLNVAIQIFAGFDGLAKKLKEERDNER